MLSNLATTKHFIATIRLEISHNYKQHSDSFYFNLIENISDNNGWLIES